MALTMLSSLRHLRFPGEPELAHIEAPWEGKSPLTVDEIRQEARRITRKCHVEPALIRMRELDGLYSSSGSAGLYGPALASSLKDLATLPLTLRRHLAALGWEESLGPVDELLEFLNSTFPGYKSFKRLPSPRRLVALPDKEGKIRTVAIMDY